MAWNEPGRSDSPNPWGGQKPAIDDLLKKLKNMKPNQAGGLALGLALLILFSGVYIVEPAEQAVILRLGRLHSVVGSGPHWRIPLIDSKQVVNVEQVRSHKRDGLMLTRDENIVDIDLTAQYKIKDVSNFALRIRNPDETLAQVTDSALRRVIGQTDLHDVLTEGREEVAIKTKQGMQELLDRYQSGLLVTEVNMQKADPPEQVKEAFDDVIKAREDEVRLRNQAESYANEVVPVARGGATRVLEEAKAHRQKVIDRAEGEAARFESLLVAYEKAPKVTRERMYIETLEKVLGRVDKVMIDTKGGQGPLLYLPMNKNTRQVTEPLAPLNESNNNTQVQATPPLPARTVEAARERSRYRAQHEGGI